MNVYFVHKHANSLNALYLPFWLYTLLAQLVYAYPFAECVLLKIKNTSYACSKKKVNFSFVFLEKLQNLYNLNIAKKRKRKKVAINIYIWQDNCDKKKEEDL